MIVFVESLGSLWRQKARHEGGFSVWNTTGIDDGRRIRPRSRVYGQVAFASQARRELQTGRPLQPASWIASDLLERDGVRTLRLLARAPSDARPERYLVTIDESLAGVIDEDSFDGAETELISHSQWRGRDQIMLLMRPVGCLQGTEGTAILTPVARRCVWRTAPWSAR